MRDAIERAAMNNARRQQRLDALKPQGRATGGDVLAQLLTLGQQSSIDRERERLQPQMQDLQRQRRELLAQKLGQDVDPTLLGEEQLQGLRVKQLEAGFKPGKRTDFEKKMALAGIDPNSEEGRQLARESLEKKPLVNIEDKTESTRTKKSEERRSKIIDSTFDMANTARETATQAATIEANLDSIIATGGQTGPAFGLLTFINNAGAQFGVDVDLNESSSLTAIEAASNKLAVPLTKQLGVNPTDKDFSIIKSTVARAGTSLPANYALVDLTKQAAARDLAKESLVIDAEEQGLNEVQLRKALNEFHKNNPLKPAIPKPKDRTGLKIGQRYTTSKGIYEFDGEKMVRAR